MILRSPDICYAANPYSIAKNGGRFCVIKSTTGEVVPGGCHSSKDKALAHLRALEANVHE